MLENITNDVNNVVLLRTEERKLNKDRPNDIKKWYISMRHKKGKKTYEEENGKKIIKEIPKEKRELLQEIVKRNDALQKKIEKSKPKASNNILKDLKQIMSSRGDGIGYIADQFFY